MSLLSSEALGPLQLGVLHAKKDFIRLLAAAKWLLPSVLFLGCRIGRAPLVFGVEEDEAQAFVLPQPALGNSGITSSARFLGTKAAPD